MCEYVHAHVSICKYHESRFLNFAVKIHQSQRNKTKTVTVQSTKYLFSYFPIWYHIIVLIKTQVWPT